MPTGWRMQRGGGARARRAGAAVPVVLVVLALMAAAAVGLTRRAERIDQPVAFNHLKHTKDLGLACEFCHPYVRSGAHAGLPGAETCGMCHQVRQGTSTEAARVTELLSGGDSLRFNKLFRLPGHVFYTHRRHAGIAGLECANCHGAIAETERPPFRPLVRITMDYCLDCHREQQQTLDCNACHR
jgi:hypothetical protein